MTDILDRAIEDLSGTANRIADQLIASRALNVQLAKALQEIAKLPSCDCGARVIAMRALNGGSE